MKTDIFLSEAVCCEFPRDFCFGVVVAALECCEKSDACFVPTFTLHVFQPSCSQWTKILQMSQVHVGIQTTCKDSSNSDVDISVD